MCVRLYVIKITGKYLRIYNLPNTYTLILAETVAFNRLHRSFLCMYIFPLCSSGHMSFLKSGIILSDYYGQ
jgi:hypothetical protein